MREREREFEDLTSSFLKLFMKERVLIPALKTVKVVTVLKDRGNVFQWGQTRSGSQMCLV